MQVTITIWPRKKYKDAAQAVREKK